MRKMACMVVLAVAGLVMGGLAWGLGATQEAPVAQAERVRFRSVEVFVDSRERPLAAYQFELTVEQGEATIVGVEGGGPGAFAKAPYYDPGAMAKKRIVIAAFNTAEAGGLPTGKTRVARLHLQVTGEQQPHYAITLDTAAAADGTKIPAVASIAEGEWK